MSDTTVQNINSDVMADLFPEIGTSNPQSTPSSQKPSFGSEEHQSDIFNISTDTNTEAGTPKPEGNTSSVEEKVEEKIEEVDILGNQPVTTSEGFIKDLSVYYQDRIKSGKFIEVKDVDENGQEKSFIPTTPEEYDEVLDLQINYRLEEAKKEMQKKWYETKSPAWKVVSQYAELVDSPAELIPFLQGVRTIQSVANLDEKDLDGAEQIVRIRLAESGDPEEVISSQIDSLKTTGKLLSTAATYKPLILQKEQTRLATEMKQKEEEDIIMHQTFEDIRSKAITEIEKPIFGKVKLKQEEKAAIYDLIGEPSDSGQGFAIYEVIDSLFDKRDFSTLKEIALLLSKKDSFYNYLGITTADRTAAALERKLRLAGESRKSSGNDYDEDPSKPTVSRNQFKTKPNFGR